MNKYLVGVLYYGPKDGEHDACMQQLEKHPRILNTAVVTGCPYIDIGRATLAEYALAMPDAAGLLFIDHDILFDMTAVDQVIESCDASEGVVGAAYSMRSAGSKMIGGLDTSDGEKVVFFKGGGRHKAHYLGMGFTAIHRKALETIATKLELPFLENGVTKSPIRPFFSLLQENGAYYGEDVSFCLRAKKAGVPVEMDTRIRIAHKGSYAFELEDCSYVVPILESLEVVMADQAKPSATPVSPHGDVRLATESATGRSTEELLAGQAPVTQPSIAPELQRPVADAATDAEAAAQ